MDFVLESRKNYTLVLKYSNIEDSVNFETEIGSFKLMEDKEEATIVYEFWFEDVGFEVDIDKNSELTSVII